MTSPGTTTHFNAGIQHVRAELRLLIALACVEDDILQHVDDKEIKTLDWRWLVDTAGRHKLVQPLFDLLPRSALSPPKWVRPALWARLRRVQPVAQRHIDELCELTRLFNENRIEFRVMRGPALSVLAFGTPDRREFSDLDVLINADDLRRTRHLLEDRGYHSSESELIVNQNCAFQLYSSERRTGLDLHWSAVPGWLPLGSRFDVMAEPPAVVEISGESVPTLQNEDTVLIQCIQCIKTAWVELDRWYDLAVLCSKWDDLDWDRIVKTCQDHGYIKSLALSLRLLGPRAQQNIPDRLRRRIQTDADLGRAEDLVMQRLPETQVKDRFQGRSPQMFALTRAYVPFWVYTVFRLSSIHFPIATWWLVIDDRRRQRKFSLWMIRSHFSPKPADYAAIKLPPSLHGAYYVVRPIRLLSGKLFKNKSVRAPAG